MSEEFSLEEVQGIAGRASASSGLSVPLLTNVLECLKIGVIAFDAQQSLVHMNSRTALILGFSRNSNPLGNTLEDAVAFFATSGFLGEGDPGELANDYLASLIRKRVTAPQLATSKEGVFEFVFQITDTGEIVAVLTDLNDTKRAAELEQKRAYRDPLTGLANQVILFGQIDTAIRDCQVAGHLACVLVINLLGIKGISDSHGRDVADEVIAGAGNRIGTLVRSTDKAARLSDHEFAILLPKLKEGHLANIAADRFASLFPLSVDTTVGKLSVGARIGLALHPDHGQSVEGLLSGADRNVFSERPAAKISVVD